jgi:RNA polymerase sigma-70 factor, ECF subfamily
MPMSDFEQVILKELSSLRSLAAYLLPNANAVDDVIQLTVIRAHEQWEDLRSDCEPGPWLRTILRFMIKTELKQLQRESQHRHHYKSQWIEVLAEHGEVIAPEASETLDVHQQLQNCREQLQPKSKELVALKYDQGLSCSAIAEQTQRTVSWVTTTLSRIRQSLKDCITQHQKD